MPRIQVLPEHIANKIAAGEVIQRPDSVVKELLENSFDAGATEITLVVEEGGKKLIQVIDNGMGMDETDAVSSFLRHATSKISTYEDLEAINTYGFRGEALASIAAVARVTLKTRQKEFDVATVVQMEGGKPRVTKEAREPGTTISVHNLFHNVPARRKFLKSNTTEFRHVYETVQRMALSHSHVAIDFVSDGEVVLSLKPAGLKERITDIFGERVTEGIVWMEERTEYIAVCGFIGKPQFGQKTRLNQFLFLNDRFINNRNITHAVFSSYENLLLKGTFPFFVLFIEIDPHRVDVNVHPSKMEAKFEDEHAVYHFISTLVRRTLSSNELIPAMTTTAQGAEVGFAFTSSQHSWPENRGAHQATDWAFPARQSNVGREFADRLLKHPFQEQSVSPEAAGFPTTSAPVWQMHNTYILIQIENGLMVIDQHVAHERVLYERALSRFASANPVTQEVLFPRTMQLTPGDYVLAKELLPHFKKLGFSLNPFGKNTLMVEGVPPDLKGVSETNVLQDVLDLYREYQSKGITDARDALAKSYSCKAAIKAGDKMNDAEMRALIDQLFQTEMPYVCPHGRPVVLKISIEELHKRFGRQ